MDIHKLILGYPTMNNGYPKTQWIFQYRYINILK